MINYQEILEKYLSDIESFLTSVLLEETNVTITAAEEVENEPFIESMDKADIFIYTRDEKTNMDIITILDNEWFGLLSSIMLGVEEKGLNEVTRDLLKKFTNEFMATFRQKLAADGIEPELQSMQVLTLTQLGNELKHGNYWMSRLEVEGLADENVKAAFLLGDLDNILAEEEPEPEEALAEAESQNDDSVAETQQNGVQKQGIQEEVISGRYIEFEEFDEQGPALTNENGQSMDLLKDVEMDVSVELGRIQLPLGKVLQLAKGSVIELEKLAGEPVDILVNGQRIAHGEVVVIDEHFGVRISNLITTRQRLATLQQ